MAAITIWTARAIWSALAPTYEQMAASRMVVAAAVGGKFPLAMTWVIDAFPPHRRAKAIGALFVVLNISPAIRSALSGVVLPAVEAGRLGWLPLIDRLARWPAPARAAQAVPLPWIAMLKDGGRGAVEAPQGGEVAAGGCLSRLDHRRVDRERGAALAR